MVLVSRCGFLRVKPALAIVVFALPVVHRTECGYVFGTPYSCAGAKFDGRGVMPGAAALPLCTFADGDNGKNLGETEKAVSGDR